jgi:3'-phosphoadenosine 5'-phosphosulfate sulfotransferase (PAPS reductase)/FAD synthetase
MNLVESSNDFENLTTMDIVRWALERFTPLVALACAFQAEESVLIDLMLRVRGPTLGVHPEAGRLNQETYDCMDAIRERYGIRIEVFFSTRKPSKDGARERTESLFTTQ